MTGTSQARTSMINSQLRPNRMNDEDIIHAIEGVKREEFVPKAMRGVAYCDDDIDIGSGRYLMEPMIFAKLLGYAEIKKSDLVLDIGCATGYSSAVISELADAVVALEEDAKLSAKAETILSGQDIVNVAVVTGKHAAGVAKQGPYDVIFVGGAVSDIPSKLTDQLKEGGRLVCVKIENSVGRGHLIRKENGDLVITRLFDANVPVLAGFEAKESFVF